MRFRPTQRAQPDLRPGQVLHRYAVRMPNGELEVCPFCTSVSGKRKVVFDDRTAAELAAAALELLPDARGRIRVHPCRIWSGVYHLTGQTRKAET